MGTYTQLQSLLRDKYDLDPMTYGLDTPLADLGFDSLKVIDLRYELEDAFDIGFSRNSFAYCVTIADLLNIIESADA